MWTYQMPRKRSILPQPCPLCKWTYGTYEYVVFNNKHQNVVCRIGHYDKNRYLSQKTGKKSSTINRKLKKPSGRVWHNFTARAPFTIIDRNGKAIDPGEYFDAFPEERWKRRGITIRPQPFMSDRIKKRGWQMIPEEQLWIARRKVKEHPSIMSLS